MLRDEGKCSLQLKQVTPKDEGEYSIVAENGAGRAQCTCQLLIDDCEFFVIFFFMIFVWLFSIPPSHFKISITVLVFWGGSRWI